MIKMNVQISFAILLAASVISSQDDDDSKEFRKHYGLSYHSKCTDYLKSFTCMTTCRSIGFRVFRMDFRCKCSCHELKTTTILPFFKWRTNGTTKTLPSTQSPNLYHVAGTLSPPPESEEQTEVDAPSTLAPITCESVSDNSTASNTTLDDFTGNATTIDDSSGAGNTTEAADGGATTVSEESDSVSDTTSGDVTSADDGEATTEPA